MKKTILTLLPFLILPLASMYAQNVSIPDSTFKKYLLENTEINTDNDTNNISVVEAQAFTGEIKLTGKISSLEGIEAFTNITKLTCNNLGITQIDV